MSEEFQRQHPVKLFQDVDATNHALAGGEFSVIVERITRRDSVANHFELTVRIIDAAAGTYASMYIGSRFHGILNPTTARFTLELWS